MSKSLATTVYEDRSGDRMILAGAGWGALVALDLGLLRWFNADMSPQRWAELPGTLALTLVWLAPFALAMIAAHQPQADTRVSLLLAAALGGLAVGVLGPVSMAGLLFLPSVLALAAATARTLRAARLPLMGALGRLAFGLVLVGLLVAAFALLIAHPDARCWALDRTPAGQVVWHTITPSPGGQLVGGVQPDGAVREQVSCISDIVTLREAAISLGPLAAVALLAWGWVRRNARRDEG